MLPTPSLWMGLVGPAEKRGGEMCWRREVAGGAAWRERARQPEG